MRQHSYDNSACLYLIPTPIGNFDDITIRSLNILKQVDFILCEDTRETGKLLSYFGIKKKLVSCHEYNELQRSDDVVKELRNGKNIGLVTDQGSPIISDPGFIVVRCVIDAGFNVIGLPGATAFVPALISSGINPSPFLFYGFFQSKESKQIKEMESLKNYPYTIIFYESVHRIEKTLKNMLLVFGDRKISIHREISKLYEEIFRDKISNILNNLDQLKGEFVIIVEGNHDVVDYSDLNIVDHVKLYLDDGLSEKDALKIVAKERGVSKSVIYKEYHDNK